MNDTGCVGMVYWDDPEGCDGEGGGRGVKDGEHMFTCGRSMSMYFFANKGPSSQGYGFFQWSCMDVRVGL